MKIEYLPPSGSLYGLKIGGKTYFRLIDLARHHDKTHKGLAQQLAKMFRQDNPGEFFYLETNPHHGRGYYASEDLLDPFVHFMAANANKALDSLISAPAAAALKSSEEKSKPKASVKVEAKPKSPERLETLAGENQVISTLRFNGGSISYFKDGALWLKLPDLARVLKPNTRMDAVISTHARRAGVKLRSARDVEARGTRAAYFASFEQWHTLLHILAVDPRSPLAEQTHKHLMELDKLLYETSKREAFKPEVKVSSASDDVNMRISNLEAMMAAILDAVTSPAKNRPQQMSLDLE